MRNWKAACLVCALFAALGISSSAQTFTTLAYFPYFSFYSSPLIQGRDGNLYGTAQSGGTGGWGTVFKMTRSGTLTTLYTFCSLANCADGWSPTGIALGVDGYLYGATGRGGGNNHGTIFKVSPSGALRVLYTFSGTDGDGPVGGLILASDGKFYGTTFDGGTFGSGTIFNITPGGSLITLLNFNAADGLYPEAPLIQGDDGNFYGTTVGGGIFNPYCPTFGCGTVFKMTPDGELTTVHYFNFGDGAYIGSPLTQGSDGNFYAPAWEGGYYSAEGCFNGCGTLFSISQGGKFTILQKPQYPSGNLATLVVASDGKLYGMGAQFYSLAPSGTVTIIYTLPPNLGPSDTVLQATDGKFYGTYLYDDEMGSAAYGLDTGLRSFVAFVVPAGKIGQTAQILGQGLTGTTKVIFNGIVAAKFAVVNDTYMTAVVPAGATTGAVVVTTPTGNLTSNVSFRITH